MNYALQEAAQALDAIERRGGRPPRQTPKERSDLINAQLRQFDADVVLPSKAPGATNFALQEAAKALEAAGDPPDREAREVSAWGGALGAHARHAGTFALPPPSYAADEREEMPALPGPAGGALALELGADAWEPAGAWEPADAPAALPAPKQIVPGLLIKFVPPGTLTTPAGYAQAPPAGPAAAHPAVAAAWGTFAPPALPSAHQAALPAPMAPASQPAGWPMQPQATPYMQPAPPMPDAPGLSPSDFGAMNRPSYVPYDNAGPSDAYDHAGAPDRAHAYDHAAAPDRAEPEAWRDIRGCITPPCVDRSALRGSITPPAIPLNQSFGAPSSPGSASYNSEEPDELDAPLKSGDFPDLRAAWPGGLGSGAPQPPPPGRASQPAGPPAFPAPAAIPRPTERAPVGGYAVPTPVRQAYEVKPPSSRGSSRSSAKSQLSFARPAAARAARMVGNGGGRPQKWTGLSTVCRPIPQPSGAKAPPQSLLF